VSDFDLVVIGDCNPDLVVSGADVQPEFGQAEKLVERATLTIGGSGAITACGAARLGLRVAFAGVVGDDVFGRFMVESLAERGVDVSACEVDDGVSTGVSVILDRAADRAILTVVGSSGALATGRVPNRTLTSARHVHVSSYFLLEGLREGCRALLETARSSGATTSLDPNWDPSGAWDSGISDLLPFVDFLMPNEAEVVRLAGDERTDPVAAAQSLAARGPTVVVKAGPDGAFAVREDHVMRAGAPETDVVDTVGAGDSFDAGFLAARVRGDDIGAALALGCACGALSTRAPGGTDAQPEMEEALAVAASLPLSG
jgi:sugar/nucleoside kinase (ribokinase family)